MSVFFELRDAPIFCNVLLPTREEALAAPRSEIRLASCPACGLIYNTSFDPSALSYNGTYENSLHFSARFRQYARELAGHLVNRHQLYGKDVIEIGCGQGEFLSLLAGFGHNRCLGFDPSYDPAKLAFAPDAAVTIMTDVYREAYADRPADLICCRHVLEHIPDPLVFLRSVRHAVGERYRTVVFFEVPNGLFLLENLFVWDIIYEHCSYFTPSSLSDLFRRAGFSPIDVSMQFGSQYLTIEAMPLAGAPPLAPDATARVLEAAGVTKFADAYLRKLAFWRGKLGTGRTQTVLWGAGAKGVSFLNALDLPHEAIRYAVDVNPRKHGKFIPGTGQQVVHPEALRELKPELVIVTNPIYQAEIRDTLNSLQLQPEISIA